MAGIQPDGIVCRVLAGVAVALRAYADKFANIRRVSSFMNAISADEMSCMARR